MESLANKYRPTIFDDVVGQDITVNILKKQISDNSFSHTMLFVGNAGCGKTTCAKILAKQIHAEVFDLDCATHNGVADIKQIVSIAKNPPLVYDYKVFILDECHTLSSAAWPALLITLEENIPHSIFILCTTDVQKVPNTIISRALRFNFMPIPLDTIVNRLTYICENEHIKCEDNALTIVAKSALGGMRQAITNLDKCNMYGDINPTNVRNVLNIVSDNLLNDIHNAIISRNKSDIIKLVTSLYSEGFELHLFIKQFLDYCLANNCETAIIDCILTIMQDIRYDNDPKNVIIARFITYKYIKQGDLDGTARKTIE